MTIEAMKQALQTHSEECWRWHHQCAIAKIERMQAQEPVAWYLPSPDGDDSIFRDHRTVMTCTGNKWEGFKPLYTAPRQWQGLTDERHRSTRPRESDYQSYVAYTRALEAYCDMLETNG